MSAMPISTIFINREQELEQARRLIAGLQDSLPLEKPALYFHGAALMGKSTLLRQIYNEAGYTNVVPALVDLDYEDANAKKIALNFWQKTYERTGYGVASASQPSQNDNFEQIIRKFSAYLHALPPKSRVLWLLDTLEKIEQTEWETLQTLLIALLETGKFALIFSGRMSIFDFEESGVLKFDWRFRKKVNAVRLQPFDLHQTRQHFERLGKQFPLSEIQTLHRNTTGGVPGLNAAWENTPENLKNLEKTLKSQLQSGYADTAKADFDLEMLWQTALKLAAFRQFDVSTLVTLELAKNLVEAHDLTTQKLIRTHLCERHPDGYGYRIVQEFRPLLTALLARGSVDVAVSAIHQQAIKQFQQRFTGGDFSAALDMVYHQLSVKQFDPQERTSRQSAIEKMLRQIEKELPASNTGVRERWFNKLLHVLDTERSDWERLTDEQFVDELQSGVRYRQREFFEQTRKG